MKICFLILRKGMGKTKTKEEKDQGEKGLNYKDH